LSENYPNQLKKKENPKPPGQGNTAREKNLRKQKTPFDKESPPVLPSLPILKNCSPPQTQRREKARTYPKIVKKITRSAKKCTRNDKKSALFTKK
jgi:hypothetical protein